MICGRPVPRHPATPRHREWMETLVAWAPEEPRSGRASLGAATVARFRLLLANPAQGQEAAGEDPEA